MSNLMELAVEERAVSGKKVKQLRRQGIVPANMFGHNQESVSLQVNRLVLLKLLSHGTGNGILQLKLGDRPAIHALIKNVTHNPVSGEVSHVDFYRVAATEKLKTSVQLHFVYESGAADVDEATVLRPLSEVMVECLPGDLPSNIQVDLSMLKEVGAVIRVGDLKVGPGVTILTDHNDMVAGMHQQAHRETSEEAEKAEKTEAPAAQ